FYSKESGILDPGVTDGELHVHPMTALDEIALKTPDLLFSGKAVEQVFGRCIPEVKDAKKLLAKDVDFLLVCLRKVSYGSDLELQYTHTCEGAKQHSYMVQVDPFIKKSKRIDPSRVTSDFTLNLTNGQVVRLAPLNFGSFVELMQANDQDLSPDELAKRLYNSVSKLIASVDGVENHEQILEWLSKLPPILMKQITEAIEKTTEWGPDFNVKIKCKDCGKEEDVQAPLNPLAFFT
ncbi:MAG: hypothetical protein KGI25_09795, partial [Thaumarchaeota archaeon]|nr:hypothetical protein [Nitrososphaerota archaeon]